jgi:hypothetical protein
MTNLRFVKEGAQTYDVVRTTDELSLGYVWTARDGSWSNRFEQGFATRKRAAVDLLNRAEPIPTKVRVWLSISQPDSDRSISIFFDVNGDDVEKLRPEDLFHASLAVTFAERAIVAGHVWTVKDERVVS